MTTRLYKNDLGRDAEVNIILYDPYGNPVGKTSVHVKDNLHDIQRIRIEERRDYNNLIKE